MKKTLFPLFSLICGCAAFVLRLLQNKTAFEVSTGLPITAHPSAIALLAFLMISAAVIFTVSRKIPVSSEHSFPHAFSTADAKLLMLPVMGSFLMAASGAWTAGSILLPEAIPAHGAQSSSIQLILAATVLVCAAGLFFAAISCKAHDSQSDSSIASLDMPLLAAPVCLVIHLVLVYRIHSINPVLQSYYVELLALVFMALAFYRLSSFAFDAGNPRRFFFYSSAAVILCISTLADGFEPSRLLLYGGSALTLLGFMLLHMTDTPINPEVSSQ